MKRRNTLPALGALTLLLVLTVFLGACEEMGGFHPLLRGIRLYSGSYDPEDPDANLVDDDHPFVINSSSGKDLVIVCDKPSSVKDEDISIALSLDRDILSIPSIYGDSINGQSTIRLNLKPKKEGTHSTSISFTAEPGGVSASCKVNLSVSSLSVGISLSPTSKDFGQATAGYTTPPTTLSVTVTNISSQATGNLTVTLPATARSWFTVMPTSISSIAVGGTGTFTVTPRTGLAARSEPYTANVTVSGSNGINASLTVKFTVNAVPTTVEFKSASANGSDTETTTQLTLTFDKPIPSLSRDNITLSGVSGVTTKGNLSGSGPSYTLPITVTSDDGPLSVAVTAPSGYTMSGSPQTATIYSAVKTALDALGSDATYNPSTNTIGIPADKTSSLSSNVTIPSGVNLAINGTVIIPNSSSVVFTLNGTMTINSGGTFEITAPDTTDTTFKVENVLKGSGSGTKLTVQNGGALEFPTTGTITDMLQNISGDIVILKNSGQTSGQLTMNRVLSDNDSSPFPTFISTTVPFIGSSSSYFEINQGQFTITCGPNPKITIPSGSKVTVSRNDNSASAAIGGGNTVPFNNDLTVQGELVIAANCGLAVFTISADTISAATLEVTNGGRISLESGSILRVSKKNNKDGQKPGSFITGTNRVYKGTTGTDAATTGGDDDWATWSN